MEESTNIEGQELRVFASDDEHSFMFENCLGMDSVTGLLFAEEFVEYKDNQNLVENEENKEEEDEEAKHNKKL